MTDLLGSALIAACLSVGYPTGILLGWLHDRAAAARKAERLMGVRTVLLRLQGGPFYG